MIVMKEIFEVIKIFIGLVDFLFIFIKRGIILCFCYYGLKTYKKTQVFDLHTNRKIGCIKEGKRVPAVTVAGQHRGSNLPLGRSRTLASCFLRLDYQLFFSYVYLFSLL
jgi:hypothetical protein